ncbi:MAG: IgGFc-binding protein [Flavobacteriales bacterium]|nr:IgGFc-binding protein [Flavobacteriales bacterium]
MLIVATEDGTEVEITPTTGTQGGQAAGVPFLVSLEAGETYQVKAGTGRETFPAVRSGAPA